MPVSLCVVLDYHKTLYDLFLGIETLSICQNMFLHHWNLTNLWRDVWQKNRSCCRSRWVVLVRGVTVLWLHVPWPRTDAPSCGRIYNLRRQPMGTLAQLLGNKPSHLLWQDPPSLCQILISWELVWPTLWPPLQFHLLWRQRSGREISSNVRPGQSLHHHLLTGVVDYVCCWSWELDG